MGIHGHSLQYHYIYFTLPQFGLVSYPSASSVFALPFRELELFSLAIVLLSLVLGFPISSILPESQVILSWRHISP